MSERMPKSGLPDSPAFDHGSSWEGLDDVVLPSDGAAAPELSDFFFTDDELAEMDAVASARSALDMSGMHVALPLLPPHFFKNGGGTSEEIVDHLSPACADRLIIDVTSDRRVIFYSADDPQRETPLAILSPTVIARRRYLDLRILPGKDRDTRHAPLFGSLKQQIDEAQPAIRMLPVSYLRQPGISRASVIAYLLPSATDCGLGIREGALPGEVVFFAPAEPRQSLFVIYLSGKTDSGEIDFDMFDQGLSAGMDRFVPYFRLLERQLREIKGRHLKAAATTPAAAVVAVRASVADDFGSRGPVRVEVDPDGLILEAEEAGAHMEPPTPPIEHEINVDEFLVGTIVEKSSRIAGFPVFNGVVYLPPHANVTIRQAVNVRFCVPSTTFLTLGSGSRLCTIIPD